MTALRRLDPRHWTLIRRGIDRLRARFFSVTGSPRQFKLDPSVSMAQLRGVLGRHYFMPSWDLAYYYEGEDLNMVRFYKDERYDAEYPWRQTHVRAFEADGGIELAVHDELSAKSHPRRHLDGETYSYERGIDRVMNVLDDAGIVYEQDQFDNPHR